MRAFKFGGSRRSGLKSLSGRRGGGLLSRTGRKAGGAGAGRSGGGKGLHLPGLGGRSGRSRSGGTGTGKRRGLHLPGTGRGRSGSGGTGSGRRRGLHLPGTRGSRGRGILGGPRRGAGGTRTGRRTLGQRLHLPGANRRTQRRAAGTAAGGGQPRRGWRRLIPHGRQPRSGQQQQKGRARKIAGGIGAALALPFAAPFAFRRWRRARKQGQSPSLWKPSTRTAGQQPGPGRAHRAWAWLTRRQRKQQDQKPEETPQEETKTETKPAPEPEPQHAPADARPRPAGTPGGTSPERIKTVSSNIDAATEAINQHVGGFRPVTPGSLGMFLQALPDLLHSVGGSLSNVADTLGEEFPVEPSLVERLREIAASVSGLADSAGEAHSVHRNAHEKELERLENPRVNEQFWDVQNGD